MAKSSKYLLPSCFYGSGIRTWLKWVPLPQGPSQGFNQHVGQGCSLSWRMSGEGTSSKYAHAIVGRVQLFLVGTEWLDWGSLFFTDYWLENSPRYLPHVPLHRAVHNMAACFGQASKRAHLRWKPLSFWIQISQVTPHHLCHILFTRIKSQNSAKLKGRGLHNSMVPRWQRPLWAILEDACHKEEILTINRFVFAYVIGGNEC